MNIPDEHKLRVLFVCTGNRARSQIAEGLLRQLASHRFSSFSAGTAPQGLIPLTIEVMREIGIDISSQRPKSVEEFLGQSFDYVITVCDQARESCPVFSEPALHIHWSVADPADAEARGESKLEAFRAAREDLRNRIERFIQDSIQN